MSEALLLTKLQEQKVRRLSQDFYNSIHHQTFKTNQRLFGIEIEFSIVDDYLNLMPGTAQSIAEQLPCFPVVPELGSYQIEINPPPMPLKDASFHKLYNAVQQARKKITDSGDDIHANLLAVGIPFHINQKSFTKKNLFTNKPRYQISAAYFKRHNPVGSILSYQNGDQVSIFGNIGVTLINELHIHLQAFDVQDLMLLFNYGQMLTAPLVALGANSGITNGKALLNKEHQIVIFENSEGLLDGMPGVPRVGLFPGYVKTLDDFFNIALSFRPLYYPNDGTAATAFELMLGKYFGWVRIRYTPLPQPSMRIEFRPLSTQPTIKENIALSEFFIKILIQHVEQLPPLIPTYVLRDNFDNAIRDGMNAILRWDFGAGIRRITMCDLLTTLSSNIAQGVFSNIIENRITHCLSPVDRLVSDTQNMGYSKAVRHYQSSFADESPYT
jgi:gamma-glutamyl:cysteine ligase YbdK (ATP-grasp superfamily)